MRLCGCASFLLPSQDVLVQLIGDSKLTKGVNVSAKGCLYFCVRPVLGWCSVQFVAHFLANNNIWLTLCSIQTFSNNLKVSGTCWKTWNLSVLYCWHLFGGHRTFFKNIYKDLHTLWAKFKRRWKWGFSGRMIYNTRLYLVSQGPLEVVQ